MNLQNSLSWVPNLTDAIERCPLTVPPGMPVLEAIALLSQSRQQTCALPNASSPRLPEDIALESTTLRTSCVLIVQNDILLGILTERDVVRLTASTINLHAMTVNDVMVSPVITLPEHAAHDIFAALFLFRRYRIRHLPIVNTQQQLIGTISNENIRQVLRPANLLRFRRVSDVMTTQVIQAPLTARLLTLVQLMARHRVSCIVITQPDEDDIDHPVGIITERDIVQFHALQIDFEKTEAHLVMSTPLFLLNPEDSLSVAHQEMQNRRVGRLVVSWNWGQGLGIITQTSLLKVFDPMEMYGVIETLQRTIQQLNDQQPSLPLSASPALSSPPSRELAIAPKLDPARSTPNSNVEVQEALVNQAHTQVQNLVNDPHVSTEQLHAQLKDVLSILEQLSLNLTVQ